MSTIVSNWLDRVGASANCEVEYVHDDEGYRIVDCESRETVTLESDWDVLACADTLEGLEELLKRDLC